VRFHSFVVRFYSVVVKVIPSNEASLQKKE